MIDKSLGLSRELKKKVEHEVVPIVVGAFGTVFKGFGKRRVELGIRGKDENHNQLEYRGESLRPEETCCYSDSSEKPPGDDSVKKNSLGMLIIMMIIMMMIIIMKLC